VTAENFAAAHFTSDVSRQLAVRHRSMSAGRDQPVESLDAGPQFGFQNAKHLRHRHGPCAVRDNYQYTPARKGHFGKPCCYGLAHFFRSEVTSESASSFQRNLLRQHLQGSLWHSCRLGASSKGIVVMGVTGSGKTEVGRRLAAALH
jgi:hypothetical protein